MNKDEYESDPLSAEEFSAWKKQRSTEKVFYLLTRERDTRTEELANGATISYQDIGLTAQATCSVAGVIAGINKILHMEVEDEV